ITRATLTGSLTDDGDSSHVVGAAGCAARRLPVSGRDHRSDGGGGRAGTLAWGGWSGLMVASSSAVVPAGWVVTSVHRSRSRYSVSLSPSGKAASRWALLCSSGRFRTAFTRRARTPGARCPGAARSDARAVRTVCWVMVTSAQARVPWQSLISRCRYRSRSAMPCLRHWSSWVAAVDRAAGDFRAGRGRPGPAVAARRYVCGGGWGLRCGEHVGQHAQVAPEDGRGFGEQGRSGPGGVLVGQFLRADKGGAGQVKRLCDIVNLMVNAGDERGVSHLRLCRR